MQILIWFTDGSYLKTGTHRDGYSIVSLSETFEAGHLPMVTLAQRAKLLSLTSVCVLAQY